MYANVGRRSDPLSLKALEIPSPLPLEPNALLVANATWAPGAKLSSSVLECIEPRTFVFTTKRQMQARGPLFMGESDWDERGRVDSGSMPRSVHHVNLLGKSARERKKSDSQFQRVISRLLGDSEGPDERVDMEQLSAVGQL
jgi:hypothetical protein